MLNHIVLVGRLVRSPELRYLSNGTAVCNMTIAVERNYSNKQGKKPVDYIDIVTWRKLAESCAHHLGKGRLVAVEGALQISKREKEGRTYANPQVQANEVRFLDWPKDKQNNGNNAGNSDAGSDDDSFNVPF